MAILKHIASKNEDYGEAQRYLMFQYNEDTMKPILDENGRLIPREEYYLDGINCDPFTFDGKRIDRRTGAAALPGVCPEKFPRPSGFSLYPYRRTQSEWQHSCAYRYQ